MADEFDQFKRPAQPAGDEFAQYQRPASPTSPTREQTPIGDRPVSMSSFTEVPRLMGSQALEAIKGAGKGALSTVFHVAQPLERMTGMEQRINRPEVQQGITPSNTAQNIGYGLEHAAEFLIPAGLVGKAGRAVEGATAGMRAAPIINAGAKALLDAGSAGLVRGAQTGDPEEAAKAAIAGGVISGGARAFPLVFPSKETLANRFQQINAAVGKEPVDVSKFAQPAMEARHLNAVTGDTNPVVLRKAFGAIQPTTEPLTFEDSRLLQSSAGRKAVQMAEAPGVVSKPMSAKAAQLAKGLAEANSEVAAKGGVGPLYEGTMKAYARRQGLENTGKALKKVAIPLAIGAAGVGAAKPIINSLTNP